MPPADLPSIILVALAMGLAAFTQGFSGFGYGIMATALVSLFAPDAERVLVVAMLTGLVVQVAIVIVTWARSRIDWVSIVLLQVGVLVFIPIGYAFVQKMAQRPIFGIVFGAVLIAFAVNGMIRPQMKRIHAVFGPAVGAVSGFLTGAFTSGGPPLVLYVYAREVDPRSAKGTLQVLFILASLERIATVQAGSRPLTLDLLIWSAALLPWVVGLTLVGHWICHRVSVRTFAWCVYALIALTGVVHLIKAMKM